MHIACQNGHVECVELLLAARAAPDAAGNNDSTPLLLACQHGSAACVRQLLAAGASVDSASTDGLTPLYVACGRGFPECADALLQAGASAEVARLDDGSTPLFVSCQNGHGACAARLLDSLDGARLGVVEGANKHGVTPLIIACFMGHLEIVELLSSFGARRSVCVDNSRRFISAESLAVEQGHDEVHAFLVASREWSPLHHLRSLTPERARAYLRQGLDPRTRSERGTQLLAVTRYLGIPPDRLSADVVTLIRHSRLSTAVDAVMTQAGEQARVVAGLKAEVDA